MDSKESRDRRYCTEKAQEKVRDMFQQEKIRQKRVTRGHVLSYAKGESGSSSIAFLFSISVSIQLLLNSFLLELVPVLLVGRSVWYHTL